MKKTPERMSEVNSMREHLHLTRVPQGAELDFIRGILVYNANESKLLKFLSLLVNYIVAGILLASSIYGLIRHINGDSVSLAVVVLGFIFSAFWFFLSISLSRVGNYNKKTNWFQYVRVCDIMLTEIQSSPNTKTISAKAIFTDGTVSNSRFLGDYYKTQPYQYGLLVAIYDVNGQWIYTEIIPRFEYGTKHYQIAQKGLKMIK